MQHGAIILYVYSRGTEETTTYLVLIIVNFFFHFYFLFPLNGSMLHTSDRSPFLRVVIYITNKSEFKALDKTTICAMLFLLFGDIFVY